MMCWTRPSAAMASSSGPSSRGMSTRSEAPAATSRTMYALLLNGPIGPTCTIRMPPSSMTVRLARPIGSCGRRSAGPCTHRCLPRALAGLVPLALGNGVHVGKSGVVGDELGPARRVDGVLLGKDAEHDASLHLAEPRESAQPAEQLRRIGDVAPDRRGVVAVLAGDDGAERVHPCRHACRETMDRRAPPERCFEPAGIDRGQLTRIEGAEPIADVKRAEERLLNSDLLVETEADQQGQGVRGEQ